MANFENRARSGADGQQSIAQHKSQCYLGGGGPPPSLRAGNNKNSRLGCPISGRPAGDRLRESEVNKPFRKIFGANRLLSYAQLKGMFTAEKRVEATRRWRDFHQMRNVRIR